MKSQNDLFQEYLQYLKFQQYQEFKKFQEFQQFQEQKKLQKFQRCQEYQEFPNRKQNQRRREVSKRRRLDWQDMMYISGFVVAFVALVMVGRLSVRENQVPLAVQVFVQPEAKQPEVMQEQQEQMQPVVKQQEVKEVEIELQEVRKMVVKPRMKYYDGIVAKKDKQQPVNKGQDVQAGIYCSINVNGKPYPVTYEEKLLMEKLVYAEARGETYEGKVAVASVILNRLKSNKYGRSLTKIMLAKGAFAPIGWVSNNQAATCRKAVEQALNGYDPTRNTFASGAIYFYAPHATSSFQLAKRANVKKMTIGRHVFHEVLGK